MPRYVDSEARVREIIDATIRTLAEGGFAKLTLGNLAKKMGGSITLITHYFPNRAALISGLLEHIIASKDAFATELAARRDPVERLHAALYWFLPLDDENLRLEQARIALVAHRDADEAIDRFIIRLEPEMRAILARGIDGFVDPEDLEITLDLLRSWTSGIALCAVEHPEIWTPERQIRALDRFLTHFSPPPVAKKKKASLRKRKKTRAR